MVDEIDEKIEEVIERKVEEKMEKQTRDEIEDSVIDKKIEERIAEKVANRDKKEKQNFVEKTQDEGISRRKFLKMLGVGAGGLALSSSAAGLSWSKITPSSQGTSDIKSSTVKDGAISSSKIADSAVSTAKLGFDFDEKAQDAVGSGVASPLTYDDAKNQFGIDESALSKVLVSREVFDFTESYVTITRNSTMRSGSEVKLDAVYYDDIEEDTSWWNHTGNAGGGQTHSPTAYQGSNSLGVYVTSTGDGDKSYTTDAFSMQDGKEVTAWIRKDSSDSNAFTWFGFYSSSLQSVLGLQLSSDTLTVRNDSDGNSTSIGSGISSGNWYKCIVRRQDGGDVFGRVEDSSGNLVAEGSVGGSYSNSTRAVQCGQSAAGGSTHYTYIDAVSVSGIDPADITGGIYAQSGDVVVDIDQPKHMLKWSLASFARELNGGSLTVDVERYDGSSWVTEQTDISRGTDISAYGTDSLRLRANMTRGSRTTSPALDYAVLQGER